MEARDFIGTYDYEKAEAEAEAEYYLWLIEECNGNEKELEYLLSRTMAKLAAHWSKVLVGHDSFECFAQYFNAKMPDSRFYI